MYFSRTEYEHRWAGLQTELRKKGYSTAVLWQRTGGNYDRAGDVYYLTHYASMSSGQTPSRLGDVLGRSFAVLIVQLDKEPELHIAEPVSATDRDLVVCGEIFAHDENLAVGVSERLAALGVEGNVALHGYDFLPVELYDHLRAQTPAITWIPEKELLYDLQSHKSSREIELYHKAGQVVSEALTALMEGLVRGERESDAAAKAAAIVISAGGGFQRIGAHHGSKAEFAMWNNPLYGYSTEAPEEGDMVRGWVYGPILEGYWIDPGRSAVCGGRPSSAQKEILTDCVTVVERLIAAHRAGITARELGKVGDDVLHELGYGDDPGAAMWDLHGHGLSMFWLSPVIPAFSAATRKNKTGWRVDEPFHVDQVCTVEVFLHRRGIGSATFEQVLLVQEGAPELLTTTPMFFE